MEREDRDCVPLSQFSPIRGCWGHKLRLSGVWKGPLAASYFTRPSQESFDVNCRSSSLTVASLSCPGSALTQEGNWPKMWATFLTLPEVSPLLRLG